MVLLFFLNKLRWSLEMRRADENEGDENKDKGLMR